MFHQGLNIIEVKYNYLHHDINFPETSPVKDSGNKSVYLLKSIEYRKSGEQDTLINAFNFEYNAQGFIKTVKYPIRDDTNGNKKGIIEYEYEPYKYISQAIFAQFVHSDPLDPVGGGDIRDATYGVVRRIEEGDKVTKYFRGIKDSVLLGGYPREVTVVHPDETFEVHNYYYGGKVVIGFYGAYISHWNSGYEKSVEYYEGPLISDN